MALGGLFDDDDDLFDYLLWSQMQLTILLILLAISLEVGESRAPSVFDQRLEWGKFMKKHGKRDFFRRHLRMKPKSFKKLISFIKEDIQPNERMADMRGGAIIPEIRLYCTIRWLAGGSYSDIMIQAGISKASFYRILWQTIRAIATSKAKELQINFPQTEEECAKAARGFQSISHQGVINNCVGVGDWFLLGIATPPKSQVSNVRSFFSGHYKCSGLNVQAAGDHHSRFIYIAVAGPGVMGDNDAIGECSLGKLIENLPTGYVVIGDAAYTPTEHNFVINERLAAGERTDKADDRAVVGCMKTFRRSHQPNPTVGSVRIRGNSAARLLMVERVRRMGLTRPAKNKLPSTAKNKLPST
jgi:hypothetical protein